MQQHPKCLQENLIDEKILKPFKHTDYLYFYKHVAEIIKPFIKNKPIATKIFIPKGPKLIKRATKLTQLYVEDILNNVNDKFLEIRSKYHLREVLDKINKKQHLIWQYFFPKKDIEFFYSTNGEVFGGKFKAKKIKLDRIFFDIDRKNINLRTVTKIMISFVHLLEKDKEVKEFIKKNISDYKTFVMYTGNSWHIYLILDKQIDETIYFKYVKHHREEKTQSLTTIIVDKLRNTFNNINIGHEKVEKNVIIDPSQTPFGKLARLPYSLHIKEAKLIDGIAIPMNMTLKQQIINTDTTNKKNFEKTYKQLIDYLNKFTLHYIIKNKDQLKKELEEVI